MKFGPFVEEACIAVRRTDLIGTGEWVVVTFEDVLCIEDILFGPKPLTMLCGAINSALVSDPAVCDLTTPLPGLLKGAVEVEDCEVR